MSRKIFPKEKKELKFNKGFSLSEKTIANLNMLIDLTGNKASSIVAKLIDNEANKIHEVLKEHEPSSE